MENLSSKFNVELLNPMQLGRLNKSLDRIFRWEEGDMSLRDYIEKYAIGKNVTKGGNYNRRYYNRLNYEEQKIYEDKLKEKKTYNAQLSDGCTIKIPKIVYDTLDMPIME